MATGVRCAVLLSPLASLVGVAAISLWLVGCGGSSEPAARAPREAREVRELPREAPRVSAAPRAPKARAVCDDGSCFSCGDAVCFSGYYCAANLAGHGCEWLPSCAERATCSCLRALLGDECACEERASGTFVTCDGAKL